MIHGVKIDRGAPSVSHLLFTDDSYLFFKATLTECAVVKGVLKDYVATSSQLINYTKSSLTFRTNIDPQL